MQETEDRLCFRNSGELFIFRAIYPEFRKRIIFQDQTHKVPPFIFKSLAAEERFIKTIPDQSFTWSECHRAICDQLNVPASEPTADVPEYHVFDEQEIGRLWPIAESANKRLATRLSTEVAQYNPGLDLRHIGRSGNGTSVRFLTKPNLNGEYEPGIPSVFVNVIEKTCESERHAELEEKILRGLAERGRKVVKVYKRDGKVLETRSAGMTVFEYANRVFNINRTQDKVDAFIREAIVEKARIYDDLDDILSQEDKDFVIGHRLKKLLRVFPNANPFEIVPHLYAYTLMKSMGIDDEAFRDRFTALIGGDLISAELEIPGFARFLSDEYTKNRGVEIGDEGLTLAFDFTPRFGLVQEDDFFAIGSMGNNYDMGQESELVKFSMEQQGVPEELRQAYLATFVSIAPYRSYLQIGHLIKEQASILDAWSFKVPSQRDPGKFKEKAQEMVQQKWHYAREELVHYLMKAMQYVCIHVRDSPLAEGVEQQVVDLHNEIIDAYKQRYFEAIAPLEVSLKERGECGGIRGYANHWFEKAKITPAELRRVLEHRHQKGA